jgi:RNA polymerase sigma-70 factor (ECF subfamily)
MNLKDLTKTISNLPSGYRTVFNMFVIDGYSHKEIAEKLHISVGTSKSQLLRAKKHLQKNLINTRHDAIGIYA